MGRTDMHGIHATQYTYPMSFINCFHIRVIDGEPLKLLSQTYLILPRIYGIVPWNEARTQTGQAYRMYSLMYYAA
jgi:hypothetical protein